MSKPRWFAICERLCLAIPAFLMALTTLLLLVVAAGMGSNKGPDFFFFGVCGWTFVYAALGGISYGGLHLVRWAISAGQPKPEPESWLKD